MTITLHGFRMCINVDNNSLYCLLPKLGTSRTIFKVKWCERKGGGWTIYGKDNSIAFLKTILPSLLQFFMKVCMKYPNNNGNWVSYYLLGPHLNWTVHYTHLNQVQCTKDTLLKKTLAYHSRPTLKSCLHFSVTNSCTLPE